MYAYYGTKIMKGAINSKTGQPWKIEDVANFWRPGTITWLEEHGYVFPETNE